MSHDMTPKEKRQAYNRAYRNSERGKAQAKAASQRYYIKHREVLKARSAKWKASNPVKVRLAEADRASRHWLDGIAADKAMREANLALISDMDRASLLSTLIKFVPKRSSLAEPEEILSELTIAVLSGAYAIHDLPKAARKLRAHMLRQSIAGQTFSLDTPISTGETYGDILSASVEHF